VIALGDDRLVFRRVDRQFWPATTCPRCAATTAGVDLAAHRRRCLARTSSLAGSDDGRAAATRAPRLPGFVENRSSARVFGQKRRSW
jgi:hypothetical protein